MTQLSKALRNIFNKASARIGALTTSHLTHKITVDVLGALACDFLVDSFLEVTNLSGSAFNIPLTVAAAAIGGAITHKCTTHGDTKKPKAKEEKPCPKCPRPA